VSKLEEGEYEVKHLQISVLYSIDLHQALDVDFTPFEKAWEYVTPHLKRLEDGIVCDKNGDNTFEVTKDMLRKDLWPDFYSFPIYIVTVEKDAEGKVVYIGQTNAKSHRFANGHLVALKLHAPEYQGFKKILHLATVIVKTNKHQIPLEWFHPAEQRNKLLTYAEANFIFKIQPVLNTDYKNQMPEGANITIDLISNSDFPVEDMRLRPLDHWTVNK